MIESIAFGLFIACNLGAWVVLRADLRNERERMTPK